MPLDALEASLLLDFYIRLRIAYKPLNRSWWLLLRSQLSGIVLRKHSFTNVELARRTASPTDTAHLLKLAEAWLDLAKLTRTKSGQHVRKIGEHPLVIAKLGERAA